MDLSIVIPVTVTIALSLIGGFRWLIRLGEQSKANAQEILELKKDLDDLKKLYEEKDITLQELKTAVMVIETRLTNMDGQIKGIFNAITDLANKLDRDFVRKDSI